MVSMLGPSPRAITWAKTLTKFVSVQLAVQALMIAGGILLVRVLSQTEYAYFTIANSMQATMNILADSGIGIGLSSIGGRVWQNPYRFGQLINTAMRLRLYLAAVAVAVITPILAWMLIANGATYVYTGALTVAVLMGLNYQLLTSVLIVVPRLHSQIGRVQRLDLLAAASRFAILITAYFVFLDAAVAVFAIIVGLFIQYCFLRRWVAGSIEVNAPANDEDRRTIFGIVKSQAPNAVFYCLQGQLTVWLVSIFGSTKNIAEIGALGRLGVMFSIIGAVMTSIVLPSFARCQSLSRLRRRYFQIVSAFCLLGLSLVALSAFFPEQMLWILGRKYAHLRNELFLMMIMTAFNALVAAMWSLNSSKAWIKRSWMNIPGVIFIQIMLLLFLDVSTLSGVLWFGVFSLVPTFLLNCMLAFNGFSGYKQATAAS
jgi:O-antigen/teichoic acid export membrane protein